MIDTDQRNGEMALNAAAFLGRQDLPWVQRIEDHPSWAVLSKVPETLTATIPMPEFTVRDLLAIQPGKVLVSRSPTSDLIPMKIGAVQIGWAEFEVVDDALAVRVAKLA